MIGDELLEVVQRCVSEAHLLRVQVNAVSVKAWMGDELVLEVLREPEQVMIGTPEWLGARPSRSAKVTYLETPKEGWAWFATSSPWHALGAISTVVKETTKRLEVSEKLARALEGRLRVVQVDVTEPEYWWTLATWARNTDFLDGGGRRFAHLFGDYLKRGVAPSSRYQAWADRTAKAARAAGFVPPTRSD